MKKDRIRIMICISGFALSVSLVPWFGWDFAIITPFLLVYCLEAGRAGAIK